MWLAKFAEAAKIALASLYAHKLRSFLTLLGIVIAVTTLIAVAAVIEGMNIYISDRVAALGAGVFKLQRFPITTSFEEWLRVLRRNKRLTMADYQAIRETATLVSAVGASASTSGEVRYRGQSIYDIRIEGITSNFSLFGGPEISVGRAIDEFDVSYNRYVCVLGAGVAEELFSGANPLDKTVRVQGVPFLVVGVAKKLGSVFGHSMDNFVHVPIGTYLKTFGSRHSITIWAKAREEKLLQEAIDEARLIMRARRHLSYKEDDDFGITTSSTINDLWKQLTGAIAFSAIAVTSIFLVVGGIVVMNIMLASVTERTREIGIRKSVGARRRDILLQFLIESTVMAAAGGVLGVLVGSIIVRVVASATPVPAAVTLWSVALAIGVSSAVGLFFGIYPASRAARLDPIAALRYE